MLDGRHIMMGEDVAVRSSMVLQRSSLFLGSPSQHGQAACTDEMAGVVVCGQGRGAPYNLIWKIVQRDCKVESPSRGYILCILQLIL